MKIPEGARVSFNDKGDGLITYPGDKFASIRVRKSDGAVRSAFLNEVLTDKELEAHARQLAEEARGNRYTAP